MENLAVFGKTGMGKSHHLKTKIIVKLNKYIIFDFSGEYTKYGKVCRTLEDFIKCRSPKVIFQPRYENDLNWLIKSLDYVKNTNIIIDEAQNVSTAGWLPSGLKSVVLMGRHRNINYAVTSQRPANIARQFTSQVKHILFFNMTEPVDLDYAKKYVNSDEVFNLPKWKYIQKVL